jgi:hypothetical protein
MYSGFEEEGFNEIVTEITELGMMHDPSPPLEVGPNEPVPTTSSWRMEDGMWTGNTLSSLSCSKPGLHG